jgi:hypothetical protein
MEKMVEFVSSVIPHLRALPLWGKWIVFVALIMVSVVTCSAMIFGTDRPRWNENTGDPDMDERMKALNKLPASDLTATDLRMAIRPIFDRKAFLPKPGHENWSDFLWVVCLTRKVLTRYTEDPALNSNVPMRVAMKRAATELMLLQDDVALGVWKDGDVAEKAMKNVEYRDKFKSALGAESATASEELWSLRNERVNRVLNLLNKVGLAETLGDPPPSSSSVCAMSQTH